MVIVFSFALNVTPRLVTQLAPGILWVAFAFAGILAMNRAFVREKEQGGLEGLLLTPVSRDAIFLGKAKATHNIERGLAWADRMAVLEDGNIQFQESAACRDSGHLQRVLAGSSASNPHQPSGEFNG